MDKEARIISHFAHALNGDDGALLGDFVYSKDLFIENVHFKRGWINMEQIERLLELCKPSERLPLKVNDYSGSKG